MKRLKEELETSFLQKKQLNSELTKERRRYSDLESKLREDSVHVKIAFAEKSQKMFDLSQQLSSLRLKNQELVAEKVVCNSDHCCAMNNSETAAEVKEDKVMATDSATDDLLNDTLEEGFEEIDLANKAVSKSS